MPKRNRYLFGILLAMITLLSQCVTPPPLTEDEKAVKYAPPQRAASLALNDTCSVMTVRRFPIAGDKTIRQFAVLNKANVVQTFLSSKSAASSNAPGGTQSSSATFAFFFRFWSCPTMTEDVQRWVSDTPTVESASDD